VLIVTGPGQGRVRRFPSPALPQSSVNTSAIAEAWRQASALVLPGSIPTAGCCDETRSHPRRAAVVLSCKVEGADLAGYARRRHGVRFGIAAVRSGDRRNPAGTDRTPDRAHSRANETLPGDSGDKPAERHECNIYCTSAKHFATVNAIYARYFPQDPPARIFVCVPEWTGPFDIEIDCVAMA
jgi:hypothetical protein